MSVIIVFTLTAPHADVLFDFLSRLQSTVYWRLPDKNAHQKMLGMMNSPCDSVEFYATNRKMSDDEANGTDNSALKKFSEVKQKYAVSYTEDGRKILNGKLVAECNAPTMWSSALLRSRIHTIGAPPTDQEKKEETDTSIPVEITPASVVGSSSPPK